jgi:hypothetical protein
MHYASQHHVIDNRNASGLHHAPEALVAYRRIILRAILGWRLCSGSGRGHGTGPDLSPAGGGVSADTAIEGHRLSATWDYPVRCPQVVPGAKPARQGRAMGVVLSRCPPACGTATIAGASMDGPWPGISLVESPGPCLPASPRILAGPRWASMGVIHDRPAARAARTLCEGNG